MESSKRNQLIKLAEFLDSFGCKNLASMRDKVFDMRKEFRDIPCVTKEGLVTPTSGQNNWTFILKERFKFRKLEDGYTKISLYEDKDGVVIVVHTYQDIQYLRKKQVVYYSNRDEIDWNLVLGKRVYDYRKGSYPFDEVWRLS